MQSAPQVAGDLQDFYTKSFADEPLSVTRSKFAADSVENSTVSGAVTGVVNAIGTTMTSLATIEHYIHLTIPKMEDGNNFGVTVQLAAIKHIGDVNEKLAKGLEELLKYAAARADALEKCKLPSESSSQSSTFTESKSEGSSKKDGDTSASSKNTVEEKKTSSSTTKLAEAPLRAAAVADVDVLYYCKAKSLMLATITGYLSALDFIDKNQEKIAMPKGSRGSASAYSSMY